MATISTLAVNLIARTSVFEKGMRRSRESLSKFRKFTDRTVLGIKRLSASMRKISRITGITAGFRILSAGLRTITRLAKLAAIALIGIGIASVKLRSDVEETSNLFVIAMGDMAASAQRWVTNYSKSLGLFESNTKKALSTFQLMLVSMGFTEKAAFDMSKGLVQITNDIASLRNLKLEDAFTKIRAGIVGESEPLKAIGILINETTIKQLALTDATIQARLEADKAEPKMKRYGNILIDVSKAAKEGKREFKKYGNLLVEIKRATKKTSFELTELEKVQLRYKAIVNATTRDQGDFKRTLDGTSNVFKIIKEQIQISANTIGKVFIPQVTQAAIVVRDWLINNQTLIASWAVKVRDGIGVVIAKLKQYLDFAKKGDFEAIFKDIGALSGNLVKSIEKAFTKLQPIAFNMGEQIALGFMKAIEGTKFGKFLKGTGEVAGNLAAPDAALKAIALGQARGVATRNLEGRIGSITERATGRRTFENRGDIDALNELKAIRRAIEISSGTELD